MSVSRKMRKATEKQNSSSKGSTPKSESYHGVKHEQSKRWQRGGSYTSGKKRISQKLRHRKEGERKISSITGVRVRGKQIKNRRA